MISPHTPPGTKVVCIVSGSRRLTKGRTYVVPYIGLAYPGVDGVPYACNVAGIAERQQYKWTFWPYPRRRKARFGFGLHCFAYAALPQAITDALTSQPLIHGRELETAL